MTTATTTTIELHQDDVVAVREGRAVVDLSKHLGKPGMPWRHGRLELEQNQLLRPIKARGAYGKPGSYHSLANDPSVQAAIARLVKTLAGTTWRLEKPELPEWLEGDPVAELALEVQWEFAQRQFYRWTRPGNKRRIGRWIRDVLWSAPITGFYLGELIARRDAVQLRAESGLTRMVRWFELPEWRAPWSLEYWLTQDEQLIGVVLRLNYSQDYGEPSDGTYVVIPAVKLLHITCDAIGSNHEGRSRLRSVANEIEMGRGALSVEAVAIEVHGAGEVFFEVAQGTSDDDIERLEEYVEHRKAEHAPGGVIPEGTKIHTVSPSTTLPDLTGQQARLERRILRGLGAEDRAIATEGGGSYAARESASADARDEYDDDALQLIAEPLEELLARAIRINRLDFGSDDLRFVPSVQYGQVEERDNAKYLEGLKLAVDSGLLKPTPADEAVVREMLDLPEQAAPEESVDPAKEPVL